MSELLPDILVSDSSGTPVAAVEIKNREQLTPRVAATLRRNLIVHGYVPPTPYFLLLSQDVGYLWKDVQPQDRDAAPNYQLAIDRIVARYLGSGAGRRLSGAELELVILQWLIELTFELGEPQEEPERTLALSGFLAAIHGGRVVAEAAA